MKISNLVGIRAFLGSGAIMTVTAVGDNHVDVVASDDADVLVRLKGVTGVDVGSVLSVDPTTGEVEILEPVTDAAAQPAKPAAKKAAAPGLGCNDRSRIAQ
jgi:hypothetical protein